MKDAMNAQFSQEKKKMDTTAFGAVTTAKARKAETSAALPRRQIREEKTTEAAASQT